MMNIDSSRLRKYPKITVSILIIALLFFFGAFWQVYKAQNDETATQPTAADDATTVAPYDELQAQVQLAYNQKNSNALTQAYETALDREVSPEKQGFLMLEKSRVMFALGNWDQALAAAKEAEVRIPNVFSVAEILGDIYEQKQQYALAADYYRVQSRLANDEYASTKPKQFYLNYAEALDARRA